jgi:hypothetical protein
VARWRRSHPQKSQSSSPIPQSVLPAHHGLSPPTSPPTSLHLPLFTALVANVAYPMMDHNNWDGNYKFGKG